MLIWMHLPSLAHDPLTFGPKLSVICGLNGGGRTADQPLIADIDPWYTFNIAQ